MLNIMKREYKIVTKDNGVTCTDYIKCTKKKFREIADLLYELYGEQDLFDNGFIIYTDKHVDVEIILNNICKD